MEPEETKVSCNICSDEIPKSQIQEFPGYGPVCEDCASEMIECNNCGDYVHDRDSEETQDGPVCNSCFEEHYFHCEDCENIFHERFKYLNDRDEPVCENCLEENYARCDVCDELFHTDDLYQHEGEWLCEDHYQMRMDEEEEDAESHYEIYPYHGADIDWNFLGQPKNGRYYGVEMEVNVRNSLDEGVDKVREKFSRDEAVLMQDGSINGAGFEIITHPASYSKMMEFAEKFGELRNECKGYYGGNCGGHIHFSRDSINELTLAKFMLFFANEKEFIEFISQREQTDYWKHEDANKVADKVQNPHHYERYDAINLSNRKTIEVRCFRSNLMPERVKKNVQFLESLIQFCQTHTLQQMKKQNYVKYIKNNSTRFKELADFIYNV